MSQARRFNNKTASLRKTGEPATKWPDLLQLPDGTAAHQFRFGDGAKVAPDFRSHLTAEINSENWIRGAAGDYDPERLAMPPRE